MAAGRRSAGWAYIAPALLWSLLFFLVPLGVMAVQSLWQRVGGRLVRDWTLANYARFLGRD